MGNETLLNNRYELIAQQGSGGMSVIYKAVDRALGRTVAIKILRPSLTKDPAFLERFRQEARSVANLSHPNIVTVHDVGNDGLTHYIVMEIVEGNDLKKIVKSQGALPVERALDLSIQICGGIGFAHRSGLVHADVKPQNILITREDQVKVTDFGIAQALSDTQPQQKQEVVWGSPHYFAPEQARGEPPSPSADVYAIGVVMFEMLTGRLPYTGSSQKELAMAHIKEPVPMANDYNPAVPVALAQIVYKVMHKEPSGRYRMADQLGHILQSYRDRSKKGNQTTAASVPSTSSQPSEKSESSVTTPRPPRPQGVAEPTARLSAAPVAPDSYQYGNQPIEAPQQPADDNVTVPRPPEIVGTGDAAAQPIPPANSTVNQTGSFYSAHFQDESVDAESGVDYVTIILAILAFIAVAGLIPLYIAVFQARGG